MREKNGAFSSGHGSLCREGGQGKGERGERGWGRGTKITSYSSYIIVENTEMSYCLNKYNNNICIKNSFRTIVPLIISVINYRLLCIV